MARRWWVGGTPRRRWAYRRRLASRRDVRGRPVTLEGTRGYDRAPTNAARPIARDHPSPRPKKTSGKTGERGPICQGPAPCGARSHLSTSVVPFRTLPMAWCSSCLSNADVPLDDIVLPRARRRPRAPLSNQKKEPATFRATQISLSPTGPSRACLSRCERFRRPSSCAPVGEGD